ncbi:hypothetical protein C8R42DRAFT_472389 [Lentinula raphanica]|nr:hypothetical protein C8R42DRAFT_472389 [Lentinula raphanica]
MYVFQAIPPGPNLLRLDIEHAPSAPDTAASGPYANQSESSSLKRKNEDDPAEPPAARAKVRRVGRTLRAPELVYGKGRRHAVSIPKPSTANQSPSAGEPYHGNADTTAMTSTSQPQLSLPAEYMPSDECPDLSHLRRSSTPFMKPQSDPPLVEQKGNPELIPSTSWERWRNGERERERVQDSERVRDRDRDRERVREWDRERVREWDRERVRELDMERMRNRDRERVPVKNPQPKRQEISWDDPQLRQALNEYLSRQSYS